MPSRRVVRVYRSVVQARKGRRRGGGIAAAAAALRLVHREEMYCTMYGYKYLLLVTVHASGLLACPDVRRSDLQISQLTLGSRCRRSKDPLLRLSLVE